MAELLAPESDEESSLLAQPGSNDQSWRLNFDGFQVSSEHKEKKPPRGLHDCLGVSGNFTVLLVCVFLIIFRFWSEMENILCFIFRLWDFYLFLEVVMFGEVVVLISFLFALILVARHWEFVAF